MKRFPFTERKINRRRLVGGCNCSVAELTDTYRLIRSLAGLVAFFNGARLVQRPRAAHVLLSRPPLARPPWPRAAPPTMARAAAFRRSTAGLDSSAAAARTRAPAPRAGERAAPYTTCTARHPAATPCHARAAPLPTPAPQSRSPYLICCCCCPHAPRPCPPPPRTPARRSRRRRRIIVPRSPAPSEPVSSSLEGTGAARAAGGRVRRDRCL